MVENLTLTKSDYQIFLEAPLHLWAHKHDQIHTTPTDFEIHLMNQGYEVERIARNFLEIFLVNSDNGETIQFQRTFSEKQFTARTDALIYKPRECPCPSLCHPILPEYSIYDIPRITERKKIQLLEQGIVDVKDVPSAYPLNDKQRKIVEVAKAGEPFIDRKAIRREFEHFEYPLYFLDYETFL